MCLSPSVLSYRMVPSVTQSPSQKLRFPFLISLHLNTIIKLYWFYIHLKNCLLLFIYITNLVLVMTTSDFYLLSLLNSRQPVNFLKRRTVKSHLCLNPWKPLLCLQDRVQTTLLPDRWNTQLGPQCISSLKSHSFSHSHSSYPKNSLPSRNK